MYTEKVRSYLRLIWNLVCTHYKVLAILLVILGIFLVSGLHEQYPDEYDSLLGGKRILNGEIPYRDWFQHHQPGAYVLAAFILPITGEHFLRFRLVLEAFYFTVFLLTYIYIRKRFKIGSAVWFLGFWAIFGLLLTFFWGQMLLADTLAAIFLMPAVTILAVLTWNKQQPDRKDLYIIATSLFLTWFTSMTYIYATAALTLMTMYLMVKRFRNRNELTRSILKTSAILFVPYIIFFLFYAAVGGLDDWWFANIFYNQNYYIYNYPRPVGTPVNPIRYSVVLINQFIGNYSYALYSISSFPLSSPINTALALFAFSYLYILVSKKQYLFALAILTGLIFAAARSNPNDIKNTDYQSSVYIMLTVLFGFLSIAQITERVNEGQSSAFTKSADTFLGLLVSVYLISLSFFALNEFRGKMYPKYMGTAPLVYDFPQVSPIIDSIVRRDEYAWVGPFEFKENFYMKAKLPSRYHWFLDHAGKIEKIQKDMISDFTAHQPTVIVFRREWHPWGGKGSEFNGFFTAYLDKNFVNTAELNRTDPTKTYTWNEQYKEYFNLDTEFYVLRSKSDELMKKLVDNGWIKVQQKENSPKILK